MRDPRLPTRNRGGPASLLAAAGAALLLFAGSALAGIVWTSTSTITSGVVAPPVRFDDGPGATNSRYVHDYQPTVNRTGFTATLGGKVGADVRVKDVVRVTSVDDVARNVTIRAISVTNANVASFTWSVKDDGATIATIDMKTATPQCSFVLPAGASFDLDLRLQILKGAGKNNATQPFELWLVIV